MQAFHSGDHRLRLDCPAGWRGFGFARTGPSLTLEAGYALGISSDEDISDITDGAVYVGIGIHVPF